LPLLFPPPNLAPPVILPLVGETTPPTIEDTYWCFSGTANDAGF
jgi:hypothetical protein